MKARMVKSADARDLKSLGRSSREGSTPSPGTSLVKELSDVGKVLGGSKSNSNLSSMMQLAVPLWIERMRAKGGPDDEDRKKAQETSEILGERGDILLHGGGKPGECADQFNRTAQAVAVLAFVPGGVDIFGSHFEAKV